jgi:hypothetical protein
MIVKADFQSLTEKLNDWFNEASRDAVADWVGKDYYDVGETDWEVYNTVNLYGLGRPTRVAEGAQFASLTSEEGDTMSLTQIQYADRIGITKRARKFDRYDQMSSLAKGLADGFFDAIDQSHADLLTNGFAGTSFTDVYGFTQSNLASDGVVLFSASHTNNINANTFSNLIANSAGTANPAISRDAIVKTISTGRKYRDPNKLNRPTKLDRVLVSATNHDLASRIIYSPGVQGTPNVDSNPLRSDVNALAMWSRLDEDGGGTDRSARWFMCDSRNVKKTLRSPFSQRPMFYAPEEINDSKTWEYTADMFYAMGADHPKNVYGSTGAN